MDGHEILQAVMTAAEAAERWGKSDRTVRQACTGYKGAAPRFKAGEFRQSGKVWLITVEGMTRVFGDEPKTKKPIF
jgi:hypothetical protein